jgi:hypothetical protein
VVGSLDDPVSAAAGGLLAGAGTALGDLMFTGLVAGAAVGAAQSALLAHTRLVAVGWTAVTAASWSSAWLVTWAVVGINADQGFYVFGSSGALVATLLSGLALRALHPAPRVAGLATAPGGG